MKTSPLSPICRNVMIARKLLQENSMDRREFLKAGIAANLIGTTVTSLTPAHAAETQPAAGTPAPIRPAAPAIMATYSTADHRKRLLNIARCEKGIRTCLRRHTITNYIPGHCVYNLAEYPSRKPYEPDETDARILDQLKAHGIGLIHLHEEWNDSQRLFGADKFTASNPAGLRRFIKMVHDRCMKIILYVSSSSSSDAIPISTRSGRAVETSSSCTIITRVAQHPARVGVHICCPASAECSTTMKSTALQRFRGQSITGYPQPAIGPGACV